jgi:hypothetical protein
MNSGCSTGPRSASGKARSSRNALKHGLRAEKLALPNEDPEDLRDREARWIEQFRPQDQLEYALVQIVVRAHLQMDRCARHQVATGARQQRSRTHRATMKVEDQVHEAHARLKEDAPRALRDLRRTGMGCGYLISQWTLLRAQLVRDGYIERGDLDHARRLGGNFHLGDALVGAAPHPERAAATDAALQEIAALLAELIERERRIREWIEEPDQAESGERELLYADPAQGSLCLRYLGAAHSVFFRAVNKLKQLQEGRPDSDRAAAAWCAAPNEPEAPDPDPQSPDEPGTCGEPKAPEPGPSRGSWRAPESSSYWANESAESLNERLSILAPKKSAQVAQGDAGRIKDL